MSGKSGDVMWKENWADTKQHFNDWWDRKGLVVGMWGAPPFEAGGAHENVPKPPDAATTELFYTEADLRARRSHHRLSRCQFPADTLPVADTDIGPGSLALFCGSEPGFSRDTVWFEPCCMTCDQPEALPALTFDPENRWWKLTEATLRRCAQLGQGKYMVGCPDLVENIDILAALRDPQTLMMDLVERPAWVEQKVREINQVWFEAYQRIYDIIALEDGSSAFGPFRVWGRGKTAKLQCDASAMFSPDMFDRFVVPCLTEQCEWLDHSLYHLDGTQAMGHLDALLSIEALDAIEWTPQAGIERNPHPRWFKMYRRILEAGKSIQVPDVRRDEIVPLLDAIGGRGVYIMTDFASEREAEEIMAKVDPFR
jgi:hypothetical protein